MQLPLVVKSLRHRAAAGSVSRYILLPEYSDIRVLSAARTITDLNIAKVGFTGDRDKILRTAQSFKIDISGTSILSSSDQNIVEIASRRLMERLAGKEDLSMEQARARVMASDLDFANLLVSADVADGVVSGSIATTAAVARSAIHCVGLGKSSETASSFFVMAKDDKWKILADCGFVVDPTVEQLACIAGTTGRSTKALLGVEPIVAMLSFSTKGSAKHANVDKVRQAAELAKARYPDIIIDGELQGDAALVPDIYRTKASGSPVKGMANVLVFPDLQAGNIAYKLLERMGGWQALGPVFQGFSKPTNDLSRGCSDEDIVNAVAITALQASDTAVARSSNLGELI